MDWGRFPVFRFTLNCREHEGEVREQRFCKCLALIGQTVSKQGYQYGKRLDAIFILIVISQTSEKRRGKKVWCSFCIVDKDYKN